jgi:hypothetical protein
MGHDFTWPDGSVPIMAGPEDEAIVVCAVVRQAKVDRKIGWKTPDPLRTANRNHIVKCVNAHAALVEALKAIDIDWSSDQPGGPESAAATGMFDESTLNVWRQVRAALVFAGSP